MNYEAYITAVEHAFVAPGITERRWAHLGPAEQQAWDAAAQAVLAWQAQKETPDA